MKKQFLLILMLASGLFYAGCAKSSPTQANRPESNSVPKQGAYCSVQIRRDYLGASRELPVSPTTSSINGAEVSVSGRFLRADAEWIVLSDIDHRELWIPRSVILLMRVEIPQKSNQDHTHGSDQTH